MWLDNLKELKTKSGLSSKQIAEKTNLPERTIVRIFSGETDHPYADTLDLIAKALNADLGDVFSDTSVVVATADIVDIKEKVDVVEAENKLTSAENEMLKAKIAALTTENELLKKEIQHKDEIIALHSFYKSIISSLPKG